MDFGDLEPLKSLFSTHKPPAFLIITPVRFRCLVPCANNGWGACGGAGDFPVSIRRHLFIRLTTALSWLRS
jgi:hypothetical protein